MLCRKAEEDVDHLFGGLPMCGLCGAFAGVRCSHAGHRGIHVTNEEFLFRPSFRGAMLVGVCATFWDIFGERNEWVFCGREKDYSEVWSLIRYHALFGF